MADRTVKVTLSAQVAGYVAGMEQAANATRETAGATEKLAQQQQAFEQMGRTAMVAGGALAAGMALSAKAAIDWDSAWAGVTKTVDGTPEQLAAVEAGLRDLTSVLPASHTEIAAVAEAAGQLGIATPNVVGFTKTMIDLGETTNLTASDAATQLARFMTVMGTSQDAVSGLGSALVDLGNNYATTEAEIMAMGMRLSGAGAQIGMTEGQVLGLSTALSSVGIEAEAGGSAMSKVMIDMASSVEKGGDRLEKFASVAGISADQFAEKWRTSPGEALAAFVSGLANAEAQGKSTFGVLEELGITEVRMRDALLRSASAADQFAGAMAQGDAAMKSNTALVDEANKRYETTAAKLGIMRNQVVDAAISLGAELLPAVEWIAEGIGDFAGMLGGLEGPLANFAAWGGVIAAGILLTGGMALAAVPKIAAYKVALATLGVNTSALSGKLKGVGSFLAGPWGVALVAAGLAVHMFNSAMDESKVSAQEMEIALKQGAGAFETMLAKAEQNETGLTKAFVDVSQHLENLPALADKAAKAGRGFLSTMSFNENAALDSIKALGDSLTTLAGSDLPRAQSAFAAFVKDGGLNDTQALTFMNEEMIGFKGAMLDAAEAAGLATDDTSLLKFALGEIGPAAESAKDGTDELSALEEQAAATQEAVSALADEIRGFGSESFNAEKAAIKLEESYAALEEAVSNGGGSLDKSTEAGRDTTTMLLDMASAANESAAATLQLTGDQDAANASLDKARQSIIDYRMSLGESQPEAEAWANSIVASSAQVSESMATVKSAIESLPPETIVQVDAETAAALEGIEGVNVTTIDDKTAYVYGDNADADAKIQAIIDKNPDDKSVRLTGEDSAFWGAWANIQNTPLTKAVSIVASGLDSLTSSLSVATGKNADGGVYAYANGGFGTGIYKGGTPIHKFAETETVWEAYISGKPDQRDRNRQIWAETGNRLGMNTAGQTTVHVPTHVTVVDADRQLIGTMQVVASREVDQFVSEAASEQRRAGR